MRRNSRATLTEAAVAAVAATDGPPADPDLDADASLTNATTLGDPDRGREDPAPAWPDPARTAADLTAGPEPVVGADIEATLDTLWNTLVETQQTIVGFPAATDLAFTPLQRFFGTGLLNNVGDPDDDSDWPWHTKPLEQEVVRTIAGLLRARTADASGDWWGFVTAGGTDGSRYALDLARRRLPGAVVYYSTATHDGIGDLLDRTATPAVRVRTGVYGEIDYDDLADQVNQHRLRPVVVVANAGTTMHEAVDDVRRIHRVLDHAAVPDTRRWVHVDAALSGIPLALTDPDVRPGFDFADGARSVVVSGHKFLATPLPCAVVVVRDSDRAVFTRTGGYTGSRNSTATNSRSGLAALALWYALRKFGVDGLRQRTRSARELAAHTHAELIKIGWPAHRHPHAITVTLRTPPPQLTARWALASHGEWSHIVCIPGLPPDRIDRFIRDLAASRPPADGLTTTPLANPAATPEQVPTLTGQHTRSQYLPHRLPSDLPDPDRFMHEPGA
jgi:histidine decarboxylase